MDYFRWLIIFVWAPLVVLWAWRYEYLKRYVRTFRFCLVASLIFSVPWDIIAVQAHIWRYYSGHVSSFWLFGLPIEEYLYIVTVTVLVATSTLLIRKRLGRNT